MLGVATTHNRQSFVISWGNFRDGLNMRKVSRERLEFGAPGYSWRGRQIPGRKIGSKEAARDLALRIIGSTTLESCSTFGRIIDESRLK